jgi:hypothetical protein
LDLAAGLAFVLFVAATCGGPIRNALEMDTDEHYEVTKGLLWAKGYPLYTRVWNDQPPLYTVLLGVLFKLLGPRAAVARALAVCFGAILAAGLFHLVRRDNGILAAIVAACCLLAAPGVFRLSCAAMLEVPAIGLALCSLWPVRRWEEDAQTRWLVLSGLVMAVALQTKLTAGIMAPALAAEIALVAFGRMAPRSGGSKVVFSTNGRFRRLAWPLLVSFGSVSCWFVMLGLLFGSGYRQAWASHFGLASPEAKAEISQLALSPALFLEHPEALWGLGGAVLVLPCMRSLRRAAFPLVLLATAALVHFTHRPYWPYYYLHFSLPIAWLTGCAVAGLSKAAWARLAPRSGGPMGGASAQGRTPSRDVRRAKGPWGRGLADWAVLTAATSLISIVGSYGGVRLVSELEEIQAMPRASDDGLVAAMKKYAGHTRWVYTEETIYAFDAGLCVIPELAVMPHKRWWSGQITQDQIVTLLKQYRPQQLLLPAHGVVDGRIAQFAANDYVVAAEASGCRLFVAAPVFNREAHPSAPQP